MQPRETVVMDAADLVISQHPKEKIGTTLEFRHSRMSWVGVCRLLGASLTAYAVPPAHGTSHFAPSRSDWL